MTKSPAEGTIPADHLLQLVLQQVARNDQLLHRIAKELKAMSDNSQALLGVVGQVEASSASLIGLAQALKAKVDEGSGAVAALAAEQAAHAATNADVDAAAARLTAVATGEGQAVTDNTPAP